MKKTGNLIHASSLHASSFEYFHIIYHRLEKISARSSVSVEQCRSPDAMVLFTVMDHDVLTANDFAGEAFLGLSMIPGVTDTNTSIDNFHGLKHTELPLMHQKNRSKYDEPVLMKRESFVINLLSGNNGTKAVNCLQLFRSHRTIQFRTLIWLLRRWKSERRISLNVTWFS